MVNTSAALVRAGSALEEKNGAQTSIPLTRTSARVMALKNVVQSATDIVPLPRCLLFSTQVVPQVGKQHARVIGHAAQEPGHAG